MQVIQGRNVHALLPEAIYQLKFKGVHRDSRNGPVIMFPTPATIVYERPTERVLFWPQRDANPFFHFMECLWMLDGRRDTAWIGTYSDGIVRYSDDGKNFHGAYGYRWRKHFGMDQLMLAAQELQKNKDNRRVYIGMWDPQADLAKEGKDFPCNVGLTLQINVEGALDLVVHNRSNDLIWGALGANAVHFSFLQEVMAAIIQVPVGRYWQVSSNLHAYVEVFDKVAVLADEAPDSYRTMVNPYEMEPMAPYPVMTVDPVLWFQDLSIFMKSGPIIGFRDPFFRQVATPILRAHQAYRDRGNPARFDDAAEILQQCRATDWGVACLAWIQKRKTQAIEKGKLQ